MLEFIKDESQSWGWTHENDSLIFGLISKVDKEEGLQQSQENSGSWAYWEMEAEVFLDREVAQGRQSCVQGGKYGVELGGSSRGSLESQWEAVKIATTQQKTAVGRFQSNHSLLC